MDDVQGTTGEPRVTVADARVVLAGGEARQLRDLIRSAADGGPPDPGGVARAILDHFAGRTAKGVGWSSMLDESEATLLLGRLRALAGEVG